jgi:hypothetical protein
MSAPDPKVLRRLVTAPDAELLTGCQVDNYRASGPGGQKRNKTSSAVRLRHQPSGLVITAEESRSQHDNKAHALRRLREQLAVQFRLSDIAPIDWPANLVDGTGRLRVAAKNPDRDWLVAEVLDAVAHFEGDLRKAAEFEGVTTSSLTRFLAGQSSSWAALQRIREEFGRAPLRKPV